MKLFDLDWNEVLRELPRWGRLTLPARRILLERLKPSQQTPATVFGFVLDEILDSGIAERERGGRFVSVATPSRGLLKVLRAMHRHPVFDEPSNTALMSYLQEHFTHDEMHRLETGHQTSAYDYGNLGTLVGRISYEAWVGELLAAHTPAQLTAWAVARGVDKPAAFDASRTLNDLRTLAEQLLGTPDGIPLRELAERSAGMDPGGALYAGFHLLVIYAGMRTSDLEPMIGLWPPVARELRRPASERPADVQAIESFAIPFRMQDMTTVLAAAASEPIRLRQVDGQVFAKTLKAIDPRLVALPPWAVATLRVGAEARVAFALRELLHRELATVHGDAEGRAIVEPTPAGRKWLARSAHGRLELLVDAIRTPTAPPKVVYEWSGGLHGFFPYPSWGLAAAGDLEANLRVAATQALLSTSRDAFTPLGAFLEHHARGANPLFEPRNRAKASHIIGYFDRGEPLRQMRELWFRMLDQLISERLLPLGAVCLGYASDRATCFKVTDIGRYILGDAREFAYGIEEAGGVIVQPNFDVVFLSPAPAAEGEIGRIAERIGQTPGVAFRISQASVLGAAEYGVTADDLLSTLRRLSSRPIPGNVEREITGWMSSVRRASIRQTTVLECPDEQTTTRVLAALGGAGRRLTPTLLEIAAVHSADRTRALKRLRAAGVFVEEVRGAGGRARPGRPRSGRRWDDDEDGD
jgi:hypothetical protein